MSRLMDEAPIAVGTSLPSEVPGVRCAPSSPLHPGKAAID
jgi:hypothetical protein